MKELKLVRLTGLEPATQGLGIPCSIRTELQAHVISLSGLSSLFSFSSLFNLFGKKLKF
jgi:hypothetical protein